MESGMEYTACVCVETICVFTDCVFLTPETVYNFSFLKKKISQKKCFCFSLKNRDVMTSTLLI